MKTDTLAEFASAVSALCEKHNVEIAGIILVSSIGDTDKREFSVINRYGAVTPTTANLRINLHTIGVAARAGGLDEQKMEQQWNRAQSAWERHLISLTVDDRLSALNWWESTECGRRNGQDCKCKA